ncbi:hypothetical protein PM082_004323 [Marasmius tenuissimus]|nr:hypothetical protein PM082_004323 [Marasmius tenuissimus]
MVETRGTRSGIKAAGANVKDKSFKPTSPGKKSANLTGTENRQALAQDRQRPEGSFLRCLGILELPLEIIIEIFTYLEPLDLLYLCRTTRHIRSFLLSRSSSERLWKSALARIRPPLPSIPGSVLDEPELVSLIFNLQCYTCGESCEGTDIFWPCKIVCCRGCTPTLFSPMTEILRRKPRIGRNSKKTIEGVLPYRVYRGSQLYIPRMVDTSLRAYHQSKGDTDKMKEWERNGGHRNLHDLEVLTDKMSKWWDEVPKERGQNILSRLKSHGWTNDELRHYGFQFSFKCIPLLNEKKLLDEQTWRKIHPQLTEVLTQVREQRIQALRETVYSERTCLLYDVYHRHTTNTNTPASTSRIPWGDFILTPEAEALNDLIYHTAVDKPVAEDTLVRSLEGIDLEGVATRWIRQVYPESESESRIFRCRSCSLALWGSKVYLHRCPHPTSTSTSTPMLPRGWKYAEYHNPFTASWVVSHGLHPWDPSRVEVHAEATEVVRKLMDACGVEEAEELAVKDPLVECELCSGSGLLRWTEAITHALCHATHTFTLQDVDQDQRSRFYDAKMRSESDTTSLADISCCLCQRSTSTLRHISGLSHMQIAHELDPSEIIFGVHWTWKDGLYLPKLESDFDG